MNGEQRIAAAFAHSESDQVPFDFCGCSTSGIHAHARQRLRHGLELLDVDTRSVVSSTRRTVLRTALRTAPAPPSRSTNIDKRF